MLVSKKSKLSDFCQFLTVFGDEAGMLTEIGLAGKDRTRVG